MKETKGLSLLRNILPILTALILIGGTFTVGFYVGREYQDPILKATTLSNKEEGKIETVDFSPFWKAWSVLNEKYVATKESDPITDQAKVWGAIEGLTRSFGDPYTVFFPPAEAEMFDSEISGNFEGVGMEIGIRDNIMTVIAPLKDTPAYRAGVLAGDKVVKINDESTIDLSIDKAIKLIRGKKGTEVRVTFLRDEKKGPFELKIIRDTINIPTIDTEIKGGTTAQGGATAPEGDVFVIRLYSFSANSPDLFKNAVVDFLNSGKSKLILDLRGNPGGYLEAAVYMASFFLPEGKVIVREDFGKGTEEEVYRSKGYNVFNKNLKFAILVDGGSASASEILAGALSEHGIAKLVGTKTFGKGSVQELVKVTPDTSLKVTIARWLTPNGNSISEGGLKPDFEVKIDPAVFEKDGKTVRDLQMEKAIEILR